MKKLKTVEKTGNISVTKSEEHYPFAGEILMNHGFTIIILNMTFGLLPVTIWGTRIKFCKVSLSEAYTILVTFSFIVFTVIFVPAVMFPRGAAEEEKRSMTNFVILMALGITHIVGYAILIVRGQFVAHKFPEIWTKLCKLFQVAVVDVYGKNYYRMKEARSFSRWVVWEYIFIATGTNVGIAVLSEEYNEGMDGTIELYRINEILPEDGSRELTFFEGYRLFCLRAAYFGWNLVTSCHVLGTMLLCYIIIIITICLKAANQQIQEVLETVGNTPELNVGVLAPKIKFNSAVPQLNNGVKQRTRKKGSELVHDCSEDEIIKRLDRTRSIMLIIEDLICTVGRLWGISLIVAAMILIASGTNEAFDFLYSFTKEGGRIGSLGYRFPPLEEWMQLLSAILVNFYFLFRCCNLVDRMQFEARTTLALLKQPICNRFKASIYEKIQALKGDLVSTTVTLSASNYFQINKFLLTSIVSQITTYVIVLLQFSQQDGGMGTGKNETGAITPTSTFSS